MDGKELFVVCLFILRNDGYRDWGPVPTSSCVHFISDTPRLSETDGRISTQYRDEVLLR